MRPNPDIPEGKRFGYLVVLNKFVDRERDGRSRIKYTCRCDCGNITNIRNDALTSGRVKSCGCYQRSGEYNASGHNTRHGRQRTVEYNLWCNMKARCTNPKNSDWHLYGGRGIKITSKWLGRGGFERFFNDIGERPSAEYSLDRIDYNGNYEPNNVRWADAKTQAHNKRILGDIKTLTDYQLIDKLILEGAIKL